METSFLPRRFLLVLGLLVFFSLDRFPVVAQDKKPEESGLELAGRSDKEPPPQAWHVEDIKSKKKIASLDNRWGFTALPPGQYRIRLTPRGYGAMEILWGEVTIAAGKTAKVFIDSGIELAGQAKETPPLDTWKIYDSKTGKQVANVYQRWGFTPLPPGQYRVRVTPQGYAAMETPWGEVTVAAGKTAPLNIDAGIELLGRSKEELPPATWKVYDSKAEKQLANVYQRWGFTPLPPGQYRIRLTPQGYAAMEIPWGEVTVAAGKTSPLALDSGIELIGRSKEEAPLATWKIHDSKTDKQVANIYQRWGFTPLPPGEYRVRLLPQGYAAIEIPWGEIRVTAGKTAKLTANSGIELVAWSKEQRPPSEWQVVDLQTRKPVAQVRDRWGFTPLPPGEYQVSAGPQAFPWAQVKVTDGQVVAVRIPDLPERLTRVLGAGRKTEKERDPEAYKKLEEEVERAIRRGAAWLKRHKMLQRSPLDLKDDYPTIGILALLHAGEFERDPGLASRCFDYLIRRPLNTPYGTYATALTAMALRDWDPRRNSPRVLECAQWLVENQGWDQTRKVWRYGDKVPGIGDEKKAGSHAAAPAAARLAWAPPEGLRLEVTRRGLIAAPRNDWDNSCSQFAVLGLHSAVHAGIKIPRETWERVAKHFRETQDPDGGWGYGQGGSSGSMTCAGLASLVVARHHLSPSPSGKGGAELPSPLRGGAGGEVDPALVAGLEWLAGHFTVEENPRKTTDHYYYLYGLERVGILAGTEFLGDHEWYPTGARFLIAQQGADGSWTSRKAPPTGNDKTYLDTCYAILFLRRATLSLQGVASLPKADPKSTPRVVPKVIEKPQPATLAIRSQGKGLPPALVPTMELVLDCSGSMRDPVEGEPKYLMARRIMRQALDELPDDFQVGFRVFGHLGFWSDRPGLPPDGDPRLNTDSELKIAIGRLDQLGPSKQKTRRQLIKDWINYVKPAGATPLVYSLLQAKKDLSAGWPGPKMVVVVTDGMETCGGKLEDVATAYKKGDLELVVNIVGFGVPAEEEKMLKEIAKQAGSKYYDARSAGQLTAALKESVRTAYLVLDGQSKEEVARGQVNGDPLSLKSGRYLVRLMGIKSAPMAIEVKDGQRLELTLDKEGHLQRQEK